MGAFFFLLGHGSLGTRGARTADAARVKDSTDRQRMEKRRRGWLAENALQPFTWACCPLFDGRAAVRGNLSAKLMTPQSAVLGLMRGGLARTQRGCFPAEAAAPKMRICPLFSTSLPSASCFRFFAVLGGGASHGVCPQSG